MYYMKVCTWLEGIRPFEMHLLLFLFISKKASNALQNTLSWGYYFSANTLEGRSVSLNVFQSLLAVTKKRQTGSNFTKIILLSYNLMISCFQEFKQPNLQCSQIQHFLLTQISFSDNKIMLTTRIVWLNLGHYATIYYCYLHCILESVNYSEIFL